MVSNENAEKVVKEPKTPIIKKYFIKSCDKLLFSSKTIKYPIKKEPIMLTIRVLINKLLGESKFLEIR